MTPHLNRLVETVQMRGHNICFYAELKNISNYHQILPLTYSSGYHLGIFFFKLILIMLQHRRILSKLTLIMLPYGSIFFQKFTLFLLPCSELQIRGSIEDNSKIIFLISQ